MEFLPDNPKGDGQTADRLSVPARPPKDWFRQRVAVLQETIKTLQARTEELKAERERLREENRALRRELTHSRLLQGIEEEIETVEAETGQPPAAPPPAEQLYHLLPSSFSFSEFFRIAESESLGSDEARRCLLHFLANDLVAQDGSRLVKTAKTVETAGEVRSD